jgi:small subunit ribosomal protein S21
LEGANIAYVKVGENESLDSALKRFKKKVENEGIIKEYKERQYFIKPSQKKHEHDRIIQHKAKRKKALSERKRGRRTKKRKKQSRREE